MAHDPKINRPVAIKTISLAGVEPTEEQAYRARFFDEAEAAGRLSHPRIVAVFDVGEDRESNPYIVMEYVAGRSLEETLAIDNARLPLHTTLQLIQEVAEGLDYAHLQGVIHRDVKPSNILIGDDGHAKIADFGIAQLNISNSSGPARTWGTPAYMSPEQLKGESVDGRSDLFSLGVILYQMVTGHRPFQGNSTMTVSRKVATQEPMPVTVFNTELPPELDRVIARAIEKNPANRYQTGTEMVVDLNRLRNESELGSRTPTVQPLDIRVRGHASLPVEVLFSSASLSRKSDAAAAPAFYRQPWQQLTVSLLTFISLFLAFVGLWYAIPVRHTAGTPPTPPLTLQQTPNIVRHDLQALERLPQTNVVRLSAKKATREINPTDIQSPSKNSLSCTLGIAVEHHFETADLSVRIDGQPSYTHPLRGAIKRRVMIFKGVEGYLSDVMQLTPGNHSIHVHVVSADGAYDESGVISGTFAAGSEQILAIGFDKHNRRMRLALEVEPLMQQSVSPTGPALKR